MSLNHIPVNFSDRRRRAIDRFTRRLVTFCGIAILLLLLFFWLIWGVLPLFTDREPALAVGIQGEQGWRIGRDGAARMIPLNGQPAEPAFVLRPAPQQVVSSADRRTLLLNAQGALTLLQPVDGAWRAIHLAKRRCNCTVAQ